MTHTWRAYVSPCCPAPVTVQVQARSILSDTKASALIWGEYDAGRVRANVTVPGESETNWVNPVDSPSKLSLVINEGVPNAARVLALFSLGHLYRQEGDLPTALRTFEKALALKPQEPTMLASLHFYAGTLLPKVRGLDTGVLSAAIDHFTQALALKPEWAENVLYNRGTNYLGRGLLSLDESADLDAAIADLSAVIKRQPLGVLPLLNRGIAYYQRRGRATAPPPSPISPARFALRPTITAVIIIVAWRAFGMAAPGAGATTCSRQRRSTACILRSTTGCVGVMPWTANLRKPCRIVKLPSPPTPRAAVLMVEPSSTATWAAPPPPSPISSSTCCGWNPSIRIYTKYHGPEAESWITVLDAGENPFTSEVRAALR